MFPSRQTRIEIYAIGLVLFLGYRFLGKHDTKVDQQISSTTLKADEKEKIIVDPIHHQVEIVTPTGTQTEYFNPHGPTAITESKNGKLSVLQRTWGTEHTPFAAMTYSDVLRSAIGINGFYWHQFDFGAGLADNISDFRDVRLFGIIAWNFYDNLSLGLTYDHRRTLGGALTLRF